MWYYALHQYVRHSHAERNHQGLGNQLLAPEPNLRSHSGQVRRHDTALLCNHTGKALPQRAGYFFAVFLAVRALALGALAVRVLLAVLSCCTSANTCVAV